MTYKVTKEDFIPAWLEALRSGKYPKTNGALQALNPDGSSAGFCCLGVLCEVAGIEGKPEGKFFVYNGASGILPTELANVLDIDPNGSFVKPILIDGELDDEDDPKRFNELTEINDNTEMDFNAIARIIEIQYMAGNLRGAAR